MRSIFLEEGFPLALLETYLAYIKGSIGSHLHRLLYVEADHGLKDVIGDGDLACAHFVSSILTLCQLTCDGVHTTVDETVRDLEASGWRPSDQPKIGAVVVWGKKLCTDGIMHRHIGFCTGEDEAVSNSSSLQSPHPHKLAFPEGRSAGARAIECFYIHPILG